MVSGQISSKMARREFLIFIIFSDANRHVLMLCRKFALIPIKIIFLRIFNLLKNQAKVSPCTIVHGLGPNFIKNGKERILRFYYIF